MSVSSEVVDKIQRFSDKRRQAEVVYEQQSLTPATLQTYNQKLDETLHLLQEQVKRQEDDLKKVCLSSVLHSVIKKKKKKKSVTARTSTP